MSSKHGLSPTSSSPSPTPPSSLPSRRARFFGSIKSAFSSIEISFEDEAAILNRLQYTKPVINSSRTQEKTSSPSTPSLPSSSTSSDSNRRRRTQLASPIVFPSTPPYSPAPRTLRQPATMGEGEDEGCLLGSGTRRKFVGREDERRSSPVGSGRDAVLERRISTAGGSGTEYDFSLTTPPPRSSSHDHTCNKPTPTLSDGASPTRLQDLYLAINEASRKVLFEASRPGSITSLNSLLDLPHDSSVTFDLLDTSSEYLLAIPPPSWLNEIDDNDAWSLRSVKSITSSLNIHLDLSQPCTPLLDERLPIFMTVDDRDLIRAALLAQQTPSPKTNSNSTTLLDEASTFGFIGGRPRAGSVASFDSGRRVEGEKDGQLSDEEEEEDEEELVTPETTPVKPQASAVGKEGKRRGRMFTGREGQEARRWF